MANLSDLPIRLISPNANTTVVAPWGFDIEVEYEHHEGCAPTYSPLHGWEPGEPPIVEVLSCSVAGVDITELALTQHDRIADAILEQLEG